ncbi:MAG TPA: hypothetical protein PKK48_04995 [Phycisphaerae bacterium]|nr:hypothetical protein [Phycisphaerae bacterium]
MKNVLYVIIAFATILACQQGLRAASLDGYAAPELEKSSTSMPIKEYAIVLGALTGIALVAVKNPHRTHGNND